MRRFLIILCIWCSSAGSYSIAHPRTVTITGRAVAYSSNLTCLNGNGYWSEIIRVEHPAGHDSGFIQFDFSLPCGKFPIWLSTQPVTEKFHLFRKRDCDGVLTGSVDDDFSHSKTLPVWNYFPGAPHDELPFGHVVPCYGSLDLPEAPVV
jgi:hypothetical protein